MIPSTSLQITETLFQTSSIGLVAIDSEFNCIEWNVGMEKFSTVTSSVIKGKKLEEIFPNFNKTRQHDSFEKFILQGEIEELSYVGVSFWKDDFHQYRFTFSPIKNSEGKTSGCLMIAYLKPIHPDIQKDKIFIEYQTLTQNSGTGIWRMDSEGYSQFVNPAMCSILGIDSPEEIKGQRLQHFFTPQSIENMMKEYEKRLQGIRSTYEAELVRKDGQIRTVLINGAPLYNEDGKFDGMISTFLDITERKNSQEELTKSEIRFRTLFEETTVATSISKDGKLLQVNEAWVKLFRYNSKDELIGKPVLDLILPEYKEEIRSKFHGIINGEIDQNTFEYTAVRKDGTTFEYQSVLSFLELPDGQVAVTTLKDISQQKKAERALIESETKFRGIFESSIVGIVFSDREGKLHTANDQFLNMIGYTREDLKSGTLDWWSITPPEYLAKDIEAAREVMLYGHVPSYEKEYFKKDGTRVPALVTASIVRNENVQVGVGFIVDISELKRSKEETEKVANELTTFLYMASHDLKGPLASVIGITNVAQKEVTESKALEYLSLIEECTKKLDRSLMNFLKIIRIKNKALENKKIDFPQLLEDVLFNLQHQATFNEVNFNISINLLDTDFISDLDLIRSILQNLIENAIKYQTRLRKPEISISITKEENDLVIVVKDNGRGIDDKIIDKIFNIFYRGDISSKGSGLGLYIVKSASENLNGYVTVHNNEEGGSTFTVKIPFK